jgi:hypothetical protein
LRGGSGDGVGPHLVAGEEQQPRRLRRQQSRNHFADLEIGGLCLIITPRHGPATGCATARFLNPPAYRD